ncbi:cupin domain-containing protein [Paeniglutamicibacter sp. NPDC091659]|uniref:cupin domain-containing protein n=1 Tax=Paeniglutamicibacter sp. NPDC091659 TaxID=3364389 RepID=UPI0037F75FD5
MSNAAATTEALTNDEQQALRGGSKVDVPALELEHEAVAPEQDGGDAPTTGAVGFGSLAGVDFGVWEMSTGTMFDVEAEEIFVVTAGRGTVVIGPFAGLPAQIVELFPGTLMRLSEGMKTVWTVTETLRKVYVTPGAPGPAGNE